MILNFRRTNQAPAVSRRLLVIGAISIGSVGLLWALFSFVVFPTMMGSALEGLNRRLASATEELDGSLTVGGIEASMGSEIVLTDIELGSGTRKILTIPRARLGFSIIDVLSGRRMPDYVALENMALMLDTAPETYAYLRQVMHRLTPMVYGHDEPASTGQQDAGSGNEGSGRRRLPEVRLENATFGLVDHRDGNSILSLDEFNATASEMDDEDPAGAGPRWEIEGALNLVGLQNVEGGTESKLELTGEAGLDGALKLRVTSSTPLIAPRNRRIPALVSLGTLNIDMDPARHMLRLDIEDLQLDELGQAVDRISGGKFGIEGEMGMDSATIEIGVDKLSDLLDFKASNLVALSVTGARFSAVFPDGRSVAIRDAEMVVERFNGAAPDAAAEVEPAQAPAPAIVQPAARAHGRSHRQPPAPAPAPPDMKPVWSLDISGMVGAGDLAFSPVLFVGQFNKDLKFIKGHLTTEGSMPVAVLSMLHNRLLPWGNPAMALNVDISSDGANWKLTGSVSARDLTYFWTKVCLVPIMGISFDADFDLILSMTEKVVNANISRIRIGDFLMSAAFEYEHLRADPVVKARITIPRQPCQAVFDAIPPVMVPRLIGTRASGEMSFEVKLDVDPERSSSLAIDSDMDDCAVETFGGQVDLDMLMSPRFIHRVVELDDDPEVIPTGPGSRSFTPISQIPVIVQQAALATEDMNFFKHKGFAPGLIRRAILLNLDKGWYVYGGSTITQQLVKNLFLSREKTLARKLEEAIIVWELERRIPKERTLELYLNCIEFGYHVYGIKAAAKAYFNKTPMELTLNEAAFIMATKPSPKSAYNVYQSRTFAKWWVERIEGINKRLWSEMGVITEQEYVDSWPWIPTFWYGDEGIYQVPEIVGVPDVPPREALGLPVTGDQALPTIMLLPGDDDDGAANDDDGALVVPPGRFDGAAGTP